MYRRLGFVEFPPQASFRLATEGYELTSQVVEAPKDEGKPLNPANIDPKDYILKPTPVKLLVPCPMDDVDGFEVGETGNYAKYQWQLAVPRLGTGVVAHKSSMLAAFKNGKSKAVGMWDVGFAFLPGAVVDMVGLEYATSEHEFSYLAEALLSGENPIVKKERVKHYHNSVRTGNMLLEIENGCTYTVSSWNNKERMRGGQRTAYNFNEIYQLPGLDSYTGTAQNLRVEKGFATFSSTPDRPWVKVLHKMGHGRHPDWHCVCDNDAYVNPVSFDLSGMMADLPDWETLQEFAPHLLPIAQATKLEPGALMSREKFKISWLGVVGGFAGRVYNFNKEAIIYTPLTAPQMFKPKVFKDLKELVLAAIGN